MLILHITSNSSIAFLNEWVETLRSLSCDEYGTFMRDTIYPALSNKERKVWNQTQISNRDLHKAIQVFQ
jgi:hypothetical protein